MSKPLLLTVVPTAITAASALALWLCKGGGNGGDTKSGTKPDQQGFIVPPNASLATDSADELSLVSWNVLADSFAPKLDYVPAEQLEWSSHRWPLIRKQLLCWQADIVLLQEVDVVW